MVFMRTVDPIRRGLRLFREKTFFHQFLGMRTVDPIRRGLRPRLKFLVISPSFIMRTVDPIRRGLRRQDFRLPIGLFAYYENR